MVPATQCPALDELLVRGSHNYFDRAAQLQPMALSLGD
jgi:hypothetical protein